MRKIFLLTYFISSALLIFSENRLVVFFSATGKTRQVAEKVAKVMQADMWEIEPLEPYTEADLNWQDSTSRSSLEYGDPFFRPTIRMCTNIQPYTTIYLGFPIWWNCCPRIIQSWVDNNDLNGKTIIVFATSSRTSIDGSFRVLQRTYPQYDWFKGKAFNNPTEEEIIKWKSDLETMLSQPAEEDDTW